MGGSGTARRLEAHSSSKLESKENVAGKVPLSALSDVSLDTQSTTTTPCRSSEVCVLHRPSSAPNNARTVRERNRQSSLASTLAAHMVLNFRSEDSSAGTVPVSRFAEKSLQAPHIILRFTGRLLPQANEWRRHAHLRQIGEQRHPCRDWARELVRRCVAARARSAAPLRIIAGRRAGRMLHKQSNHPIGG